MAGFDLYVVGPNATIRSCAWCARMGRECPAEETVLEAAYRFIPKEGVWSVEREVHELWAGEPM